MDNHSPEQTITVEQQDAFDGFIVDSSSRIREILKIEEKVIDDNTNFITWIVGVASGGFLLFLSKLKELTEKALSGTTLVRTCFVLTLFCYLGVIFCSLLFRLLYKHQLYRLVVDNAAFNAQEAYMKSTSKGVVRDRRGQEVDKSDYVELLVGMMMKRYLPKKIIDNWLTAMKGSKWKANCSNALYWIAILAFVGEYTFMIYAFWKLYQ